MTQDQDRRALLTAFAQYPSPAGLGPVLGSVGALAPVAARPRRSEGEAASSPRARLPCVAPCGAALLGTGSVHGLLVHTRPVR